jgi:hypothetical protein
VYFLRADSFRNFPRWDSPTDSQRAAPKDKRANRAASREAGSQAFCGVSTTTTGPVTAVRRSADVLSTGSPRHALSAEKISGPAVAHSQLLAAALKLRPLQASRCAALRRTEAPHLQQTTSASPHGARSIHSMARRRRRSSTSCNDAI